MSKLWLHNSYTFQLSRINALQRECSIPKPHKAHIMETDCNDTKLPSVLKCPSNELLLCYKYHEANY